jgi:GH15 family glucan-1,4-alpha-glucosidase
MNWDYRFSWLRDATFTLAALLNAGFGDEAVAWRDWLLRAVAGDPDKMRIMYRVDGSRRLEEWTAPWLPGFRWASPVRVGNAASSQLQLDVYGEVVDTLHLAAKAGMERSDQGLKLEEAVVRHVERIWQKPDQGMWESRGKPRHYVYSKVMAWVAVDRYVAGHATTKRADKATLSRMTELRARMHEEICREGFDAGLGTFVASYGSQELDASLLLLPLVGFLPADDERITSTIAAIERDLLADGLVRRGRAYGDNPEGAFLACSCWLADCQAMQGRHEAARKTFDRVLSVRNDLGLLAEEYNVKAHHLSGNFPQALSHLALVQTALGLCGPVIGRGGG